MNDRDLAALAEQIRAVRAAEKRFMNLWQVEQVPIGPEVLDRLAADIDEVAKLAEEFCDLQRDVDRDGGHPSDGGSGYGGLGYRHSPRWPMNKLDGPAGDLN
jgi:hypothetical protein